MKEPRLGGINGRPDVLWDSPVAAWSCQRITTYRNRSTYFGPDSEIVQRIGADLQHRVGERHASIAIIHHNSLKCLCFGNRGPAASTVKTTIQRITDPLSFDDSRTKCLSGGQYLLCSIGKSTGKTGAGSPRRSYPLNFG